MHNAVAFKDTFRSLRHPNYRLFFGGQSISLVGTWIQRIAMPWLVYDMTKSVMLLGLVGFLGQIPTFLLAPYAGVLTDRWNKYHILLVTQVLSMIQACILSVLIFSGSIEVWSILVLSAFLGCVNAFDAPARQAFLIEMVEDKDDLGNAIALNSSMFNGARLVGPSIAGVMIALTGEGVCFLINALSYIFVLGSLFLMKVKPKENKYENKSFIKEFREGLSYTFGFLPIKYIIMLLSLVSLMGMPYTVLMPVFAKEILHGGPHTFGFLMGASGLGALACALLLASRKKTTGLERLIPLAAGFFGMGLVLFSFSRSFILSLIFMALVGYSQIMQTASSNTLLQTVVADSMRGRVMSFYAMGFMGTAPFGSLLAGWLAKVIGAPYTILFGGLSCIAGAIVFTKKLPAITSAIRESQSR
jgi:MFS family permease